MNGDVVVVDAVRTPFGRRNGGLSTVHPSDLLGVALGSLIERTGLDPILVEQVIGGCVSEVGEQSFDIARTAWLAAGLPLEVAGTTVDAQCGSSEQAFNLAAALVAAGVVDVAVACGVESMSRVPIGSAVRAGPGRPLNQTYKDRYEITSQFEAAERIADRWEIGRQEADEFGLRSQTLAAQAWDEGRFAGQLVAVDAPLLDDEGKPTGEYRRVDRDEGLRTTSLEALAGLKPVAREHGVHTAGTSSQISDGASAALLTTEARAASLGLQPRARVVDSGAVGVDPVLMLTGPIDVTRRLLGRAGLAMGEIDVVEINEAFASVVLAWQRELGPDPATVNPNGGAIALGHPLGATGVGLVAKALFELERRQGRYGLVTMCCGGGLGIGTLLERA